LDSLSFAVKVAPSGIILPNSMQRDLRRLADDEFDLLVVGGGATGACIARDAALRGSRVALVEADDFAHATSAHNSKLVHGGLRYLRNFELGLVRESLKERRIWQRIAPHLVRPLPFLVPIYGNGFRARATLSAGLTLYDLLSFDRGWLDDPAQRLPGHRWFGRAEALAREPALDGPGFAGAFLYYDAQMYAPERLALECLVDAADHGAALANHCEAARLLIRNGKVEGASARCRVSAAEIDIRAKSTIVAAGPWADLFLNRALGTAEFKLIRSKGIHLVVPAITRGHAFTVATPQGHFFVLPWRGYSLLGTTDTAFAGSPDSVGVSEADIASFLAFVNANLPMARIRRQDVKHFYAGLRPLVDDGSRDTYGASRRAELIDHRSKDNVDGLISAIGGKWTTSRDLAEQAVDMAMQKLGRPRRAASTATLPLPGGRIGRLADFAKSHAPDQDHIARLYGAGLERILSLAKERPEFAARLSPSGDIGAQVAYAVREEMALTLDDVVTRRTGIGQLGKPDGQALSAAAAIMANELGWSDVRKAKEIESVAGSFATLEIAA
jgi:glycerol-3-phosphate dehydrogenase